MKTMNSLRVMIADDDKNIRQTLQATLQQMQCEVHLAHSAEDALTALGKYPIDFLLTDFKMTEKSGIELIHDCKALNNPPVIVVMTAYASFENAVNAIQAGAFDYLPKPFSTAQLRHLLTKVLALVELRRENLKLRSGSERVHFFKGMTSLSITRLEDFIAKVAPSDATVLLTGESGTGKSELARLIHQKSTRSSQPFVTVDCGTLTESLLESELFGHAKGAFSGALSEHVGKIELACGGTLFIDEIAELSPSAQTRFLRFLQEKVIERVGSNTAIQVDARIIAATNRNLEQAVQSHDFREDLYFRLNVFECPVVSLRYRKDDLPLLISLFLKEFSAKSGRSELAIIPDSVFRLLLDYHWPGNIRELRNCIERMVLLSCGREIQVLDLPQSIQKSIDHTQTLGPVKRLSSIDDVVRGHIERVLLVEPNQERAAEILGITTVTLWKRRKEYGLP